MLKETEMYYILPVVMMFISLIYLVSEYIKNGLTLVFMSNVWFLVIFCLAPIAVISSYNDVANKAFFFINENDVKSIYTQLVVLLFYMAFLFGIYVSKHQKGYLSFEIVKNKFVNIIIFLIFSGVLSLIVFFVQYGGFDYVVSNLNQIRSGHADVKSYLGAFFLGFYKLVNLSFFICFAKCLVEDKRQTVRFKLFLVFNFLLCCFGLYISAGRENAIGFLISLLAIYILIRKKIPVKFLLISISFALFYIVFGKTLVFAFTGEDFDIVDFFENHFLLMLQDSYNLIMMEFSHQYMSLVNFHKNGEDYRWFGDYFYWLFIPFKLMGLQFEDSISYYNTYIIMGKWESIIPPGPVAFGYISLGVIGVSIHGFLMGYIFKFIDLVFNLNIRIKDNYILIGFYGMLITTFTYIMSNSDLALFFQNRLAQIVFFLILIFYFKMKFSSVRV